MGRKEKIAFFWARWAYKTFIRNLLVEKINDPNETWDNKAMKVLDTIFM